MTLYVEGSAVEIAEKTALVTGGGGGIGRVIARRLGREGAAVFIVDVDEEGGAETLGELTEAGCRAAFIRADVTRAEDVRATIERAQESFGSLDILVNNAGGFQEPVFPDAPLDHWGATLDLNLRAVMLSTHYAARAMAARGGAIVSLGSSAGHGYAPHHSPEYAAAKAAVIRLTAALASLAERGIRVNCVSPHTVGTPEVRARIAEFEAQGRELPEPLKAVLIDPEDVAEAVVRFVRDDSLAGRVMVLWGGRAPRLLPNESPAA